MDIRHLKAFAAAAERESFTRAAQSLGLTQAAVSQQVAALERELSATLFQRRGRGVRLTEQGQRLYGYARQILDLVDQASLQVGQTEEPLCGVLRIATSTVPSEWLLPELLAEFRRRWPQVKESVTVSDSRLATAAVEEGEAEVGFVGERPRSTRLQARPVAEDELVLVVAADHPLAGKKSTTLKRLCREPLIVREAGSGSRCCVERALEEHDISPADLNIAMEVNSNDAIRAAVEQQVGVAFFSQRAIRPVGNLATIKVRGFRPRRQLYVISHPEHNPTPPARQFRDFVEQWRATHFAKRRRPAKK
ncbi:MAG: LysR family transcriptional regulator [Planctomycetales bacterium]|nr:LysR family transcriptional regulator [Planctomycetales bacterium]NIO34999.1 LysR family transcriptional regulator [Planctomycetales bacterium]NIP69963.1 LysR family transcriptional regulator [Planctomycetales bacterium]